MSSLITIPPELAAALSPKDMQRLVAEQLKELFHELILRNPNVLKQKVKTYLEPIFHFLRMNVLTYEEIQCLHAEFAKEFVRKVSVELKVKKKYVTGSLVERIDEQDAIISLLDLKSPHDVRLKIPARKVQDRLKISYDALDWEAKQVFLDIACFFSNKEKTKAIYMWQSCGFEPYLAVKELVDASLIKLADDNKFSMHDQLRDLGRKIVRDERLKDPGKPCSRIWMHEDALKVLREEEGKENVEMLSLSDNELSKDCILMKQELKSFKNLRFLSLCGSNFSGDLEHALPKLVWLSWHSCPEVFQGTNLYLKNLIVLDLSRSLISETWKGWCQIGMCKELKVLDLTSCHRLTKTPDLSVCTKLERLILQDCMNLVEIDNSVGTLKCLKYLNASGCPYLRDIPEEICSLDGVEEIVMVAKGSSQDRLKLSDSIGRLSRLKHLSVSLARSTPPNSLGYLKSLVKLDLSWSKMAELPKSIGGLVKLEYLSLYFCREIKELPDSIGDLKSLAELDISMSGITRLPSTIEYLQELKVLNMRVLDVVSVSLRLKTKLNAGHTLLT
ncbi:hypothetical protein CDL15_Pgr022411 [Punica granatum]|uniref:Uncharacterized protein n=1 Tax=Punica granatum TaxID=22663 RepID=A0A218XQU1_PUNGR|nr:hypothetical protein CDL15_Pgr022411 [Punica granatum]